MASGRQRSAKGGTHNEPGGSPREASGTRRGVGFRGETGIEELRRRLAQAEAALDLGRRRKAVIFATVSGGLAILDGDGRVVRASPRFAELRRDDGELVGRPVFDVLDVAEPPGALHELLDSPFEVDRVRTIGPVTCRTAGGEVRRVNMNAALLPSVGDRAVAIATEDVTDALEYRRHREEADARLSRAGEVAAGEAARYADRLRLLLGDIALIEERERRRIAQLLHGDLQQLLLGARLSLEHIQDRVTDPGAHAALVTALDAVGQAIGIARSFAAELLPPVLEDRGLVAAVRWLGRQYKRTSALTVWVEADPDVDGMNRTQRVILFQAVSELLLNVAKHARASHVDVSLRCLAGDVLQISVCDDGVGFDPTTLESADTPEAGLGLFTHRQRVETLGGRMTVASRPERGTRVTLELPLWRDASAG